MANAEDPVRPELLDGETDGRKRVTIDLVYRNDVDPRDRGGVNRSEPVRRDGRPCLPLFAAVWSLRLVVVYGQAS
jgi:hypothetical protein